MAGVNGNGSGSVPAQGRAAPAAGAPAAAPARPSNTPPPMGADIVRKALEKHAERIPLRALEKRGFRAVQVLDMATIEKIVAEAVTHCLERRTDVVSSEDRARIETEARSEFAKLLAEHKKLAAEKTEEERRAEEMGRQVQGLRAELARQTNMLAGERDRAIAEFTLSPDSFREMDEKIRRLFAELVTKERRYTLAEVGPEALKGMSRLESDIAQMLDHLLEVERDRFIGSVKRGHSERVNILEKRISKLNRSLAETEDALRRMAESKVGDPGIASIFSEVQGLSDLDNYYAKKKELLAVIFEENLVIQQKKEPAPAERAPAAPAAAPPPAVVRWTGNSGFEPPLDPVTDETAF